MTNADIQPQPPVFGSPLDSKWSGICYLQFVFTTSGVLEHKWRGSLKLHYCYSNFVKLSIYGRGDSMP